MALLLAAAMVVTSVPAGTLTASAAGENGGQARAVQPSATQLLTWKSPSATEDYEVSDDGIIAVEKTDYANASQTVAYIFVPGIDAHLQQTMTDASKIQEAFGASIAAGASIEPEYSYQWYKEEDGNRRILPGKTASSLAPSSSSEEDDEIPDGKVSNQFNETKYICKIDVTSITVDDTEYSLGTGKKPEDFGLTNYYERVYHYTGITEEKAAEEGFDWEEHGFYNVDDLDQETEITFMQAADQSSRIARVETHDGTMADCHADYVWYAYSVDNDKKELEEEYSPDRQYVRLMDSFKTDNSSSSVRKQVDRYECEVTLSYGDRVVKKAVKKFPVSYEPLTVVATQSAISLRENGKATLKVSARNNDNAYCKGAEYQWYRVDAAGKEYVLEDETADTLKVKVTDPTNSYKCIVTPKIEISQDSSLKGLKLVPKKMEKTFTINPTSGYRVIDRSSTSLSAEVDEEREFFVTAQVDEENGYKLSYLWEKYSKELIGGTRVAETVGTESKLKAKVSERRGFDTVRYDYAKDENGELTDQVVYYGSFNYKLTVSVTKDGKQTEQYCYYFTLSEGSRYSDNYYTDDLGDTIYLQKGESVELSLDSKVAKDYRAEKDWYQMVAEEKWYYEYEGGTGVSNRVKKFLSEDFQEPDLSGTEYIEIYNSFNSEIIDGHEVFTSKYYKWIKQADSYVVSGDDNIPGEYLCKISLYYQDEEDPVFTMESRFFKVEYQSDLTAYVKNSEVGATLGASAELEVVAANRNEKMYPITYTWSKLNTSTGEYVELSEKSAVYHLDAVERSDYGTYQVLVEDGAEEKTLTVSLYEEDLKTVVYTPEKSYFRKSIGETIDLKADILFPEGVKPFYEWYRYESYSISTEYYNSGADHDQPAEYWELLNQDDNHYKVNIASERDYTQYKCIVSYKNKNTVYSKEFVYDVSGKYAAEIERMTPNRQIKKMGDSATYRVRLITEDPDKDAYSFKWYRWEDGEKIYIEGATKPEYKISSLKAGDFTSLYCELNRKTDDPEKDERIDYIDFYTSLYTSAYLENSSETKQVKLGDDVTLEPVILKGDSYNFTYQWYRYDPDDHSYWGEEKIHGATKKSYKLTNLGRNELTMYRCDIQLDGADVMSYYVTLKEDDTQPEITMEPEYDEDKSEIEMEVILGKSVTMEVKAESSDDLELKYQWYYQRSGYVSWEAIGGATSASYTIDVVTRANTGRYKCVATDTEGNQAERVFRLRDTTNMEVTSDALYLGDTLGYEVAFGGEVVLTATATIDSEYDLFYQWYHVVKDEDGISRSELLYGETKASLTLSNIRKDDLGVYTCVVSDAKGNGQTLRYYVYVDTGLNVIPGAYNPQMREDGSVRMFADATANAGETITYQWSKLTEVESEDGDDTVWEYVDITGAASHEYIVSKLTEETAGKYRLIIETSGEMRTIYYSIEQSFTIEADRTWAEQNQSIEVTAKFYNPYADTEYVYEWYALEPSTGTMRKVTGADGPVLKTTTPKYHLSDTYHSVSEGYLSMNYRCRISKKTDKDQEIISDMTTSVGVLQQFTYDTTVLPESNHPNDQRYSVKGFQIEGAKQLKITFDPQTDLGSATLRLIDSTGKAVWTLTGDERSESVYYVDGDKVIFLMTGNRRDVCYGYKVTSIEEMKEPVVIDASCKCQTADQLIAAAVAAMKASAASGSAASGSAVTTKAVPKKGSKKTVNKITYRVTKSAKKNGTVAVASVHKSLKKVNLGATVKLNGYTFKITSIDKKAFSKAAKLSSVTIGKNVKSIGASAFAGRKKLKKITIKATGLKKIGKKAFSKVPKKAVATVPKKQKKAYKKLLKKAGYKGKVK